MIDADDLWQQVVAGCTNLLQAAVRLARDHFRSTFVPTCDVEVMVMEPSEPDRWSSKRFVHQEIDTWRLHDFESNKLHKSIEWMNASNALQTYVDANNIRPIGFQVQDVEGLYLVPLFRLYLRTAGGFVYRKRAAEKVVRGLLDHLDSPAPEVRGLIVLEDLSSGRPFRLEPSMGIRPILQDELVTLGRTGNAMGWGLRLGQDIPRTDWWVCEVRLPNPRGTADGFNRMHDVRTLLALALRAFKPGRLSIGLATAQVVGVFGRMGQIRGARPEQISRGEGEYSLSDREIPAFRRFWRKFRNIMEQEHHYLQVPIRRLRAAGTRTEREDALVDYVVGLEALLGTEEERTEVGYKFRVRGSVLLAKRRSERRDHLRFFGELYRLRSRIVHGQTVSGEELEQALPKAESALRTVWRWYFDRYADRKDNRAGIEEIDEKLVGA